MAMVTAAAGDVGCIREVWRTNLKVEMDRIAALTEVYEYISVDTEFPGVVARPMATIRARDFQYQTLRCNVDILKVIQLGITLSDAEGNVPEGVCTWQFNFNFNINVDMYAQDSIELLRTHGLDFQRHMTHGIDVDYFAELLMVSGLVLQDSVVWLSFHGMYDFAYLLSVLTAMPLPATEREFFDTLALYFPKLYDLKILVKHLDSYYGGLNSLASQLNVQRIGTSHQAGSDSLLTLNLFFRMLQSNQFRKGIDAHLMGSLYGLGQHSCTHLEPVSAPPSTPGTANGNHAPPSVQAGGSQPTGPSTVMEGPQVAAT